MNYEWFLQAQFPGRYYALPFFPPDPSIELTELGVLGIDASQVPQRGPMWFKIRGEMTGSAVPKFIGYFAPKQGSKEAASFAVDKRETFTGWKLVDVTMGRLREPVQIACLLAAFPTLVFYEAGYATHPTHPKWGASPDGYIVDPDPKIPASTMDSFPGRDGTRGIVEFKASRWDCEIKAYHLAQVVWEIMCTDTLWCNVVRYSESWVPKVIFFCESAKR
jgi:hypothetical protein